MWSRLAPLTLSLVLLSCAEGNQTTPRIDGRKPHAEGLGFPDSATGSDGPRGESPTPQPDHGQPDHGAPDRGCAPATDVGATCTTTLPGVCSAGGWQCSGVTLTCVAKIKPGDKPEECNGLDDDCNGLVDDGAAICASGNSCLKGQCQCNGGAACAGAGKRCCAAAGCVDLATTVGHCGSCGVVCGVGETCSGSACRCGTTVGAVGGGPACTTGAACVGGACAVCNAALNLAPQAAAASSGGGSAAGYDPTELNNGLLQASCKFHWITASSTPGGKWIQYTWPQPVVVGSIAIDTAPASQSVCSASTGRALAGGTLQAWIGTTWQTIGAIAGKTDDWTYAFTPLTTTKLRLYDLVAYPSGMASNPIVFEWRVFCQ